MDTTLHDTIQTNEPLILIVDDIPRNLQVLGSILGENGYSVNVASNGQGALDSIATQVPDLLLLDIQMPDIDGIEVCKRLQSDPHTASIPIIFLTARTETDDIVRGFESGAVDYITKPFFFTELLARVRTHLKIKKYSDIITSQNQNLQRLHQEKNELLGIITHDITNPITRLQAVSELLERKSASLTPEQIAVYAQDLHLATNQIMGLNNNLLSMYALDSGTLKLEIQPVDINEIVREIIEKYRLQAEVKNITVNLDIQGVQSPAIHTDRMMLTRIMDNLFSNALHYSPQGKTIHLLITCDKTLRIAVIDEGSGITDEEQRVLFIQFAPINTFPTVDEPSTGLGLFIVHRLTQLLNGTISYINRSVGGSEFIFELPLR